MAVTRRINACKCVADLQANDRLRSSKLWSVLLHVNIFSELQRRNVFRVTVAYVISAWLLAQVADLVLDNIAAPDWVMQTILLVLVLGLAPVVFFSWA